MTNYGIYDGDIYSVESVTDFIRYKTEKLLSNINKLRLGKGTTWKHGSYHSCPLQFGEFRCITKGESPRLFSVKNSAILPSGKYSFSEIKNSIAATIGDDAFALNSSPIERVCDEVNE